MVLASLVIDTIKLSERTIAADNVGVTKETPHLSQSHRERFFTLDSLDLLGVQLVPTLKLRVMSKKNILGLFLYVGGILLKDDKIRYVNQLAERVLLDFFLGLV